MKNVRPLGGRPLIAWSIDLAKRVPALDRVVVSTESEDIAAIATAWGADVPFMRPAELATDTSVQIDTIIHAVSFLEEAGDRYDAVVLLQPTCPLRSVADVEACIDVVRRGEADTVITVVPVDGGLPRLLCRLADDGTVSPLQESPRRGVFRQAFEPLHRRVGSVYVMTRDTVMVDRALYGERIKAVVVDESRAFDIDSPFDWDMLEAWINSNGLGVGSEQNDGSR